MTLFFLALITFGGLLLVYTAEYTISKRQEELFKNKEKPAVNGGAKSRRIANPHEVIALLRCIEATFFMIWTWVLLDSMLQEFLRVFYSRG